MNGMNGMFLCDFWMRLGELAATTIADQLEFLPLI